MVRAFRTPESYAAEQASRDLIKPFLEHAGFTKVRDERVTHGAAQSQTLHAVDATGKAIRLRVRLCWRERPDRKDPRTFSAAQLQARVTSGKNWTRSITLKINREKSRGVTHLLLAQPFQNKIIQAAMIPIDAVVRIWEAQRTASDLLIKQGRRGARSTNHAMNGASPTLWLRDDKAPEVANALWRYPGVLDLTQGHVEGGQQAPTDDSFADLTGIDVSSLGTDNPDRFAMQTLWVPETLNTEFRIF